jgi:glutathione S-transferase
MLRLMSAKLYGVPASHPVAAVEKALQLKGIDYKRVDLVPVFHKLAQKLRFGSSTVPGLVLADGRKVTGSVAIMRLLDEVAPEPALLPADPEMRAKVQAAEEWGDRVLQSLVRRVIWTALGENTGAQASYSAGVKLTPPVPAPMAKLSGGTVAWAEKRIHRANPGGVKADLADLPRHLDRVEAWLEDGVLGSVPPNAADLQIAAGLRLLMTVDDVAEIIEPRPAGAYALRVFPDHQGRIPKGALPAAWIPARP